jgi:hypothetical protein
MQRIAVLTLMLAAWTQVASAVTFSAITTNNHFVKWAPEVPEHLAFASGSLNSGIVAIASESGVGGHTYVASRGEHTLSAVIFSGGFSNTASDVLGSHFGADIDSFNKKMRVVSNSDQHFELSLTTNEATHLPDLTYLVTDVNAGKSPNIVHLAFNSEVPGAAPTALYGIDTGLNTLVRFTDVNGSTLETVGSLGVDVNAEGGFDIDEATGIAYAALMPANESESSFYTIDLATGAATKVGVIGGGVAIKAFAVPEPTSLAILAVAASALGLVTVRRRRA